MKIKINNYTIDNKKCKASKWVQRKTLNDLSKCNLGQAMLVYSCIYFNSHQ